MSDSLRLTWVNVGYGEALLIEVLLPAGRFWRAVVDGGSAQTEEYQRGPKRVPLDFFLQKRGIVELDLVINSHPHEDHIGGLLPVLRRCQVGAYMQTVSEDSARAWLEVVSSEPFPDEKPGALFYQACLQWVEVLQICAERGIPIYEGKRGEHLDICPAVQLHVLGPLPAQQTERETLWSQIVLARGEKREDLMRALDQQWNAWSLVLRLDAWGKRILLPGDCPADTLAVYNPKNLRSDLCKVGHHGQRDGWSLTLQEQVGAQDLVCCASSDRKYQSADPQLLGSLAEAGVRWHFSDSPPVPPPIKWVPEHEALQLTWRGGDWEREYLR